MIKLYKIVVNKYLCNKNESVVKYRFFTNRNNAIRYCDKIDDIVEIGIVDKISFPIGRIHL